VDHPGTRIDPEQDRVTYGGRLVRPPDVYTYLILNKPRGVIVTVDDPQGRRTVMDLIDGVTARVYPVGRLDMDTGGILILTDDGVLAHHLMHPRFGVEKTYVAEVEGQLSDEVIDRLASGVRLEDGPTAPARVRRRGRSSLEVTIHEGRNRQVRRMCEAVGFPVISLERIAFGPLKMEGLDRGQWRRLETDEVALLTGSIETGSSDVGEDAV
jgi:pseudouridine synthase